MSENADIAHSPTLPLPPPKSGFQRLAGVIFSPGETFQDIARKPDVLLPLLLIIIISFVGIALTMPHMDWDAMIAQQQDIMKERNPNMSAQDLARVERMTRGMAKFGIWFAPFIIVAMTAIIAGVLLLAFRLFGGEGNFMQAWSATLYAWVPRVIQQIVGTAVVMMKGMVNPQEAQTLVKSNPGFLVDMKEHPALFSLLSSFDIFTIWFLVLLVIGFAALAKVSRGKAAAIILSLWLLVVLIKSGAAGLFGRMGRS